MTEPTTKGRRIAGAECARLGAALVKRYAAGENIRWPALRLRQSSAEGSRRAAPSAGRLTGVGGGTPGAPSRVAALDC
jgi:hypothetical protein